MQRSEWRIPVLDAQTVAVFEPAAAPATATFIFAHGAGGHRDEAGLVALAVALRERGIATVRFNFLYREAGSRRPDAMPRLQATIAAVTERARAELSPKRMLLGGRSMGGRAASMMAAEGFGCDGLMLFAYPLHPAARLPIRPGRLRTAHLAAIEVPVLGVNGTRDALCDRALMESAVAPLTRWTQHWLEGADHSFRTLKSSGRTQQDVIVEAAEAASRWMATPFPAARAV